MKTGSVYVYYNIYDRDDNLVFSGGSKQCGEFLGISRVAVEHRYKEMLEIGGYFITRRDEMIEYEKRRKNKRGYQRVEDWFKVPKQEGDS